MYSFVIASASVTCQASKDSASEIIHNPTKSNVILFSDLCPGHRPQQPAKPAIRQARSRRTKNTSSVSPLIVTSSGLRHLLFTVAPLYSSPAPTGSHRRRRSSAPNNIPPALNLEESSPVKRYSGANYGLNDRDTGEPLPTIPGTPGEMSLSRSPSPRLGGGWSTPGLNTPHGSMSGQSSPRKGYGNLNGGTSTVTWASAKAKSDEINGYPAFSTRSNGFFSRHYRSISNTLPRFNMGGRRDYAEKEKLGRGRWYPDNGSKLGRLRTCTGTIFRRMRLRLLILLAFVLAVVLFYVTRKPHYNPCTS